MQAKTNTGNLPQRIAGVRDEVFGLVGELQRTQVKSHRRDLERAADQMQSIANQLGTVEATISTNGH